MKNTICSTPTARHANATDFLPVYNRRTDKHPVSVEPILPIVRQFVSSAIGNSNTNRMTDQQSLTLPTSIKICNPVSLSITVARGEKHIGHPRKSWGCLATTHIYKGFYGGLVGLWTHPLSSEDIAPWLAMWATPYSLTQYCSRSLQNHRISGPYHHKETQVPLFRWRKWLNALKSQQIDLKNYPSIAWMHHWRSRGPWPKEGEPNIIRYHIENYEQV